MDKNNWTKIIHDAAVRLRDEGPWQSAFGICTNVVNFSGYSYSNSDIQIRSELSSIFLKWPDIHTSGNPEYPVGGEDEYYAELSNNTVWNNTRRIELLKWLIEETKELMVDGQSNKS